MLGLKHWYTLKTSENPKVDFATYEWFRQERFKGTAISGKLTEIEILYELKLKFASELASGEMVVKKAKIPFEVKHEFRVHLFI